MEQRDYFNGIYVTEDNDGTVYRWRVHRGELFTLPESTYGAELIDSLDLSIKKYNRDLDAIRELCEIDMANPTEANDRDKDNTDTSNDEESGATEGVVITGDQVDAVLNKSLAMAQKILKSREVPGELLIAAVTNAAAIPDDGTAYYYINVMNTAVEALEDLPYIIKKIYGLMYDCSEYEDPQTWYEQEITNERELFRRRYKSEFINGIGEQRFNKYMQVYYFDNCADYYSYMLIKFASQHKMIRVCRCCGRLFIPINKKNTMYCNRVFNKKGQTCKEIGPKIMSKEKNKSDPMLEEYERVKNKNYKRYDRQSYRSYRHEDRVNEKELSFSEYQEWQQEAFAARAEYLNGTLSAEEFGKVINKLG